VTGPDALRPDDVRVGAEYEAVREQAREANAAERRRHRVDLGERLSLVFETPESFRGVLEETLRNEGTSDPDRVAAEVAAANAVAPAGVGIAASIYLDVSDAAELAGAIVEVEGLTGHLFLDVGGDRSPAQVHGVDDEGTVPASIVVFALSSQQRAAWREGAAVVVGVDHPMMRTHTVLGDQQRALIAGEL